MSVQLIRQYIHAHMGLPLRQPLRLRVVLDRYKETTPRDPTIRDKFNTYRFIDYKESVIDLLQRVCTVSVETMKIVAEMNERYPVSAA